MTAVATKPTPQAAVPITQSRMPLTSITRGREENPLRIVLYGPSGIGKTKFGADAPAPIILQTEEGSDHLDVARFPMPGSWEDVLGAVRTLTNEQHSFKSLVVDTLDHAEPLLWDFICKRDKMKNLDSYGFGKGVSAALEEWRVFIAAIERLRREKRMNIIFLAHSWSKTWKNPTGEDYDRYEMKLNAKASGFIKEWSKAVLFAMYETYAAKDDKTKRVRGVSTGARLIYTEQGAAYDAKNRYGLPPSLPLSWADFEAAVLKGQPASPAEMKAEIEKLIPQMAEEFQAKAIEATKAAAEDASRLCDIRNRCRVRVSEMAAKAEALAAESAAQS